MTITPAPIIARITTIIATIGVMLLEKEGLAGVEVTTMVVLEEALGVSIKVVLEEEGHIGACVRVVFVGVNGAEVR